MLVSITKIAVANISLTELNAQDKRSLAEHIEKAPYVPAVPSAFIPEQSVFASPQTKLKSSSILASLTVLLATHSRDLTIHSQSDESGVGGRLVDASQDDPSAGQSRGAVLVGV